MTCDMKWYLYTSLTNIQLTLSIYSNWSTKTGLLFVFWELGSHAKLFIGCRKIWYFLLLLGHSLLCILMAPCYNISGWWSQPIRDYLMHHVTIEVSQSGTTSCIMWPMRSANQELPHASCDHDMHYPQSFHLGQLFISWKLKNCKETQT